MTIKRQSIAQYTLAACLSVKLNAVFNIVASLDGSAMCMYQQGLGNSGEKSDAAGMMVCKAFKND